MNYRTIKFRSDEERFWSRVKKTSDETSCWNTDGANNGKGHTTIKYLGKRQYIHRVSWMMHFGNVPIGLFVCHTCDNPHCIRPSHLFLGTHQDNMLDAAKKQRFVHKLTLHQVLEIRRLMFPVTQEMADRYKVSRATIHDLLRRKSYKHLAIEESR